MLETIIGFAVGWLVTRAYYTRAISAMAETLSEDTLRRVYAELTR
jgi:hypothetical protein